MCGIAGLVSKEGSGSPKDLHQMSKILSHRGPDDEGFLLFKEDAKLYYGDDSLLAESTLPYMPKEHLNEANQPFQIGLLHRRLSILDLSSAGHQPLSDSESKYWITFNGEVYNYIELRSELEAKGHSFYSKSDTEVVLHAYMEWGTECFSHFIGMWSVAILNLKENRLILSRDRTGVKPMYYKPDSKEFIFASELKAIHAIRPSSMNPTVAIEFLISGNAEESEDSLFSGVRELKPSSTLSFDLSENTYEVESYYKPSFNADKKACDETSYQNKVAELKALLQDSVNLHLRSDAPLGTCLSGGIDSSALSGLISAKLGQGGNFKTFTAQSSVSALDESSWAKEAANFNGFDWFTVKPRVEELQGDLDELTYFQELPMISLSTYAQFRVMKMASEHGIKVLMNGQGADELFAGYPHYTLSNWKEQKWSLQRMRDALSERGKTSQLSYITKELLKEKLYGKVSSVPSLLVELQPQVRLIDQDHLSHFVKRHYAAPRVIHEGVNRQLHYDFHKGPLKNLLRYEDRNSMAFSVESRVPFSDDHRISELAFELNSFCKLRGPFTKMLLRDATKEYMPESIYRRSDKMGFVSPNNLWIRELKDVFYESFNRSNLLFASGLGREEFEKLLVPQGEVENYRSFRYISLALWMQRFKM